MFFDNALSFLFPKKCIFCKKYGDIICLDCFKRIEKYEKVNIVCLKNKSLDFLIYFFKYEKLIRKLILEFKFLDRPILSEIFVKIILKNKKICGKFKFYDIIIPVPMYKTKKKYRGYNQTELIASKIANNLGIYYSNKLLLKTSNTKRQSSLGFIDRVNNVKSAFEISNKEFISGKKIILIDDIYTTGATLNECAKTLKLAGAKEVIGVVIAKD